MKSAFLTAIFGITAPGAILLAVPAEEKATVVKSSPATWAQEYGAPGVPQIEQDVKVPEPSDHYYSVVQAKTEKQASLHHKHVSHVSRPRPNFFERLVADFINLQKPHPAKSTRKPSPTTWRH
jgi:hypothetical protein